MVDLTRSDSVYPEIPLFGQVSLALLDTPEMDLLPSSISPTVYAVARDEICPIITWR